MNQWLTNLDSHLFYSWMNHCSNESADLKIHWLTHSLKESHVDTYWCNYVTCRKNHWKIVTIIQTDILSVDVLYFNCTLVCQLCHCTLHYNLKIWIYFCFRHQFQTIFGRSPVVLLQTTYCMVTDPWWTILLKHKCNEIPNISFIDTNT